MKPTSSSGRDVEPKTGRRAGESRARRERLVERALQIQRRLRSRSAATARAAA